VAFKVSAAANMKPSGILRSVVSYKFTDVINFLTANIFRAMSTLRTKKGVKK
jgi:hypothetical protein